MPEPHTHTPCPRAPHAHTVPTDPSAWPTETAARRARAAGTCPLELLSNGDWTLRFSGRGKRRATESYMHRVFGVRRRPPAAEAAPACDCVLALRNTPTARDPRARAKINGLVAGGSGRISWANRFHMNLNPNVLTGR